MVDGISRGSPLPNPLKSIVNACRSEAEFIRALPKAKKALCFLLRRSINPSVFEVLTSSPAQCSLFQPHLLANPNRCEFMRCDEEVFDSMQHSSNTAPIEERYRLSFEGVVEAEVRSMKRAIQTDFVGQNATTMLDRLRMLDIPKHATEMFQLFTRNKTPSPEALNTKIDLDTDDWSI